MHCDTFQIIFFSLIVFERKLQIIKTKTGKKKELQNKIEWKEIKWNMTTVFNYES